MTAVACPCDGCDYSGNERSVEAHISGKADDAHRGKVGREYRDELVPLDEDELEDESKSIDEDEMADLSDVGGDLGDEDVQDDVDGDGGGDLGGAAPAAAAAGSAGFLAMDGVDVDGKLMAQAAAGITAIIIIYLIWKKKQSDSGQSEGETAQQEEQPSEDEMPMYGGLATDA